MKKLFSLILCFCILFPSNVFADTATDSSKYELWAQSPYITSGYTEDDIMIYKSYTLGVLELYPLAELGDKYYLAICSDNNYDGGTNGKTKTSDLYIYIIYLTDNGFIVLSKTSTTNEYWWDHDYTLSNIANQINASYYSSNGSEIPVYILNPLNKYVGAYDNEYDEYFFITDRGRIYKMSDNSGRGAEGYPYIKDNKLYRGQNKYSDGNNYYTYYMPNSTTQASNSSPVFFKDGSINYGTATKIELAKMTAENGYNMYTDGSLPAEVPRYTLLPGSDNSYFTTEYISDYNRTDRAIYYSVKVRIYNKQNGYMNLQDTFIIPTRKTTPAEYANKSLASLDASFYSSHGYSVPVVLVGEYGVITSDNKVYSISLDPSVYTNYHIGAYNDRLVIVRAYTGNNKIYHVNPVTGSYCYWQAVTEILFQANGIALTDDLELPVSSNANPGQNGYYSSSDYWHQPDFEDLSGSTTLESWFGRKMTNYFSDGRYVTAKWVGLGSGLAELWYNIYNADDSLQSTGPTGYSTVFDTMLDRYGLITFAINNTKFIACVGDVGHTFVKEYYRAAVVSETENGDVSGMAEIGEKRIIPPSSSDTEIIQNMIDFSQNELPIGYNIKNNVVDSGKLDAELREQVNAIRLNDIVILKKEGYINGEQNTGVTLSSYSNYDYSLGNTTMRFYTNGQYFRWYCNYPEDLSAGIYDKTFNVGDKTVYVTIKIIQPPTNSGSTTVVF